MLPGATMMTLELDEEQGYYTLGHVTMDTPVYVLSVTITSASRLSQVRPYVCSMSVYRVGAVYLCRQLSIYIVCFVPAVITLQHLINHLSYSTIVL